MSSFNSAKIQKLLVFVTLLTFAASLVIAYLNQANIQGIYYSTNGEIDRKYYQEISPAGTAFAIVWPIIYLWNAASVLYIFISVFLSPRKSPVNFQPTLIPISFLVFYTLGFGTTIGWLFAFDREILVLGLFLLFLSAFFLYGAIAISYKSVYDNLKVLEKKEHKAMLWLVRILIQNGLCLPATWLTIATCLNLTDVIIYQDSFGFIEPLTRVLGDETTRLNSIINASTGVLALLFAIIMVWFVLDNFVLEKYTRYTFTVFPVFILGLSGLVGKLRFQSLLESNRNLIFASVILGFTVVFFLIRIGLFVYRLNHQQKNTVQTNTVVLEEKA